MKEKKTRNIDRNSYRDVTEAEEGQKVTLTATAKAGYRLKEIYQIENVEVKDGTFVMPAGDFEKLVVKAVFETDKVRRENSLRRILKMETMTQKEPQKKLPGRLWIK